MQQSTKHDERVNGLWQLHVYTLYQHEHKVDAS